MLAYMMWPKTLKRCVDCTLSAVGGMHMHWVAEVGEVWGVPVPTLLHPPWDGQGTNAGVVVTELDCKVSDKVAL